MYSPVTLPQPSLKDYRTLLPWSYYPELSRPAMDVSEGRPGPVPRRVKELQTGVVVEDGVTVSPRSGWSETGHRRSGTLLLEGGSEGENGGEGRGVGWKGSV